MVYKPYNFHVDVKNIGKKVKKSFIYILARFQTLFACIF